MKKPPLQDVIIRSHNSQQMRTRRSVSHEEPEYEEETPARRNDEHDTPLEDTYSEYTPPGRMKSPITRSRRRRFSGMGRGSGIQMGATNKKWLLIAVTAGLILILVSVALSLLFAGATLTVYPKHESYGVGATLIADVNGAQDALKISKSVIERTKEEEVVALGEEEVKEKASGNITIYNELSGSPQRVIKNTRFKTEEGLVFRVGESVEIPGKKPDGTPGSIEVTVTAEEAGEEYNIGPSTFVLPGFEEAGYTEHFTKIYAKSTTNMEGGFDGVRMSVSEDVREKALRELETDLRDELQSVAFEGQDVPEGYHLFKDAVFFEFENMPEVPAGTDKVKIVLKGKLHTIYIPIDDFETRIADMTIDEYKNAPIYIKNLNDLTVSVTPENNEEGEKPWNSNQYRISTQGKALIIWEFDDEKLKNDFAGKEKSILETPNQGGILTNHPGIDRIEVNVRPFWKSRFPESTEDILVLTELDD